MKRILLLTILCLPLFTRAAYINGQSYVSISDWGRANGFRTVSLTRDQVILTNKTSRLVFNTDAPDAEVNGVDLRLSFPVAKGALISQLDLDTAIKPLVFVQKPSPKPISTICIDPGHGGKDTGNRISGFFWHNEKVYTLSLAFELRDQLQKLGFKVILTRNSDTFVELPTRPVIANRAGADLFISLHFNAGQSSKATVQGPETYCITPVGAASSNAQGEGADHSASAANRVQDKSLLLAYQMQKSLVQNLHATDRDVRRARFAVLRDAQMPAILIEGGYMTHPVEGKKIFDAAYRKQMAAAIVKGILNYQRLASLQVPVTAQTTNLSPLKVTNSIPTKINSAVTEAPPSPGKDPRKYPSPRQR